MLFSGEKADCLDLKLLLWSENNTDDSLAII